MSEHEEQALTMVFDTATVAAEKLIEEEEDRNSGHFGHRYEELGQFAAGGSGELFKAKDNVFNRIVAVKRLRAEISRNQRSVADFLRECRITAQLDHPAIPPMHSLGRGEDGNWRVAMKLVDGVTMRECLNETVSRYHEKPPAAEEERQGLFERLEVFIKVCEAIAFIHTNKINHCDLKPDNLMIGRHGEVYVMDWGNARLNGSTLEQLSGTPGYIAPELFTERKVTPLLDVFALGMILFELVSLNRAVAATTTDEIIRSIRSGSIRHIRHICRHIAIAPALEAIILKALEPDPANRYPSVEALLADVRHFVYDEEVSVLPDNCWRKFLRRLYRHRFVSVIAAALAILLLAGAFGIEEVRRSIELSRSDFELMTQLQFQHDTESRAAAVERMAFAVQSSVLMFADNLTDKIQEELRPGGIFYDNHDPDSVPPDTFSSPMYTSVLSTNAMVRIQPADRTPEPMPLFFPQQFVDICTKILHTNLTRRQIDTAEHSGGCRAIATPGSLIHRLYVEWSNGVRYSYPWMRDNLTAEEYLARWQQPSRNQPQAGQFIWSQPYHGTPGLYRVFCKYPLYGAKNRYFGLAGAEVRFAELLQPLREHEDDLLPGAEQYILSSDGVLLEIRPGDAEGGLAVNAVKGEFKKAIEKTIQEGAHPRRLAAGGKLYRIAYSPLPTFKGWLIQLDETRRKK